MVIWKYEIGPDDSSFGTKKGAKLLSVGVQGQMICIWALVDPLEKELIMVEVLVIGTGNKFPENYLDGATFLGTVFVDPGLVFHIWSR